MVARLKVGASVLDIGCCFGQDLRYAAADGVPTEKIYSSDIVRYYSRALGYQSWLVSRFRSHEGMLCHSRHSRFSVTIDGTTRKDGHSYREFGLLSFRLGEVGRGRQKHGRALETGNAADWVSKQ